MSNVIHNGGAVESVNGQRGHVIVEEGNNYYLIDAAFSGIDEKTLTLTLNNNTIITTSFLPPIQVIEDVNNGNTHVLREGYNSESGSAGENIILGYYNTITQGWGNFVTGTSQQSQGSNHTLLGSNNKIEGTNTYNTLIAGAYNVGRTMYTAIFGYNNKDRHPAIAGTMPYPDGGNLIAGFNNYVDNGMSTAMFGSGHIQTGNNLTVVGQASINLNGQPNAVNNVNDARFIVGNGSIVSQTYVRSTPSNAFVVYHSGLVVAPTLTTTLIDSQARSLVTREYLQAQGYSTGGTASAVEWVDILNKPTTFTPSAHIHSTLTRGAGLLGTNYDGATATTWSLDEPWLNSRYFDLDGANSVTGINTFSNTNTFSGKVLVDGNSMWFNTQNGQRGLYITRYGESLTENVKHYLEDIVAHQYYQNDERHGSFMWTINNTDTETNVGANANTHTFEFLGNEFGAYLKLDGKNIATEEYVTNQITAFGGEDNVQSDWNATSGAAFILNKPILNIVNWNTAFNKRVTGVSITGTSTKTITITLGDGTTVGGSFTDISSSGGTSDGNDYVSGGNFNTSTGQVTLTRIDGGTVTFTLDGRYEPTFTKNTAFNKNFGTVSGTVSEGNHLHTGVYEPTFTKNTAFNKNFGTVYGTIAQGNDGRILNGQSAFDKRVVGVAITGTDTKTVKITFADSTFVEGTFTDISSTGGGTVTETDPTGVASIAFTGTTSKTLTITRNNGTTVTGGFSDINTDTTYTAGTGLSLSGTVFTNTAPDKTVSLTGSGATTITGTYPNFTIASTDTNTNTERTDEEIRDVIGATIIGGGATTVTVNDTANTITISSTDTNTDTNTTYTAGNGLGLSGTIFSVTGGTGITATTSGVAITAGGVGATQLAVTGNGTTAQYLRSDGDGTFTWATPENTSLNYYAGSGLNLSGTTFTAKYGTVSGTVLAGSWRPTWNDVTSKPSFAPVDAQKNSDITKTEIENKLTGNVDSHIHSKLQRNYDTVPLESDLTLGGRDYEVSTQSDYYLGDKGYPIGYGSLVTLSRDSGAGGTFQILVPGAAITSNADGVILYRTGNSSSLSDWKVLGDKMTKSISIAAGGSYTLKREDLRFWLNFIVNNSSATVIFPKNIFTSGEELEGHMSGTGSIIFTPSDSTTYIRTASTISRELSEYGVFGIKVTGSNSCLLFGSLNSI